MGFFTLTIFDKKTTEMDIEQEAYTPEMDFATDHHEAPAIQSVEDFEELMNEPGASFDELLSTLGTMDEELRESIINRVAGILD